MTNNGEVHVLSPPLIGKICFRLVHTPKEVSSVEDVAFKHQPKTSNMGRRD